VKNADATMMKYIAEIPDQFAESLQFDYSFTEKYKRDYFNILVSGVGGSAIGGDILRIIAQHKTSIPIAVNRNYDIPAYVNENTLFLAVSYSGNTEETIASVQKASDKKANIICITSGGKIAKMADLMGWGKVILPGGLPPRAATGYLFAPLALILEEIGYLPGVNGEIQETIKILKYIWNDYGLSAPAEENKALSIARELKRTIPVIWGAQGATEISALRWKTQLNENTKCLAYYNVFPELNHNELVGLEIPDSLISQMVAVFLCDNHEHYRIKKRMEITQNLIADKIKKVIKVNSQGESLMARIYSLCYIGDLVSVYLAAEYDIDPNPTHMIDYLKEKLADV
jgi:glucose/mannose-6-phosphate isomerase